MNNHEAALKYLSKDWSIIPINPTSKKPCLESWIEYQKRLPTIDEINDWWSKWPWANIGVVTGKLSGVSVVDVDPRHGGTTDNLPDTVKSQTGGGGWHYFCKYCPDVYSLNDFGQGISRGGLDIKSDGGYVILPPSVHNSGNKYVWITPPFVNEYAPLPDWIIGLVKDHSYEKLDINAFIGTKEGRRDSRLFGMAYTLLRFETKSRNVLDAMFWLNSTFKPPLEESIVLKKFESAATRLYRKGVSNE